MGAYCSGEKKPRCKIPSRFKTTKIKKELNPNQRRRLQDIFNELDTDGNGELDLHEFSIEMKVRIFNSLGYHPDEEHVEKLFQAADTNGDGHIDFSEFSNWILTSMGKPKNTVLHNVFDMFDTNRDGKISAQELKEAFDKIGDTHITLQMCETIVNKVDKNKDGVIEYKEFKKMWKRFLKKNGGMTPLTMQVYSTSAENMRQWNMACWDSQSTIGSESVAEEDFDHLLDFNTVKSPLPNLTIRINANEDQALEEKNNTLRYIDRRLLDPSGPSVKKGIHLTRYNGSGTPKHVSFSPELQRVCAPESFSHTRNTSISVPIIDEFNEPDDFDEEYTFPNGASQI